MRLLALAAVLALLLAGCSNGGGKTGDAEDGGSGAAASTDGGLAAGNATSDPAPVAAPVWQVGQSWTWTLSSGALDGEVSATTVVLAADGGTYDFGATNTQEAASLYPFHLVGVGAVDAGTLAWQAHGTPVQLLRFPLRHGDVFTADFWSAPGAQVTIEATTIEAPGGAQPGYRSTVAYSGGGTFLQADYAPALGQFTRVASHFGSETPFAEARLARAEGGATGTPFRVTDLARFTASAGDPSSLAPRPFTMPAGSEIAMLACFLPGDQGFYSAQMETAGVPTACAGGSAGQTKLAWTYTTTLAPNGSVTAAPGGQGSMNVEAFAIDNAD